MFKQVDKFLLVAAALAACCSSVSAAIFETQHLLPGATLVAKSYPPGGRAEGLHKAGPFDHAGNLQFPLMEMGFARSEDLLWAAIGDAGLFSLHSLSPDTDATLFPVEAEKIHVLRKNQDGAVRAPAESASPEVWAMLLVGAGLVWSQLRRRNRRGAIHFTAG